jgi:hypothetical protein
VRGRKQALIIVSVVVLGGIGLISYQVFRPRIAEYRKYLVLSQWAEDGDPAYQRLLAEYFYDKGDFQSSFKWEQRAARAGDAGAQNFMGLYFRYGINVQLRPAAPDYATAREWFEKAAAQDYPTSQAELCEIYSKGIGLAPDHELAYFWCSVSRLGERTTNFKQISRDALDQESRQRVEDRVTTWIGSHRQNR